MKERPLSRTIGWGILGTGRIAHDFAKALGQVPEASLHAVCSRSRDKAQGFAARFGLAKAYDQLADMLKDPGVDVVYVATPPSRHAEDCLAIIAANKAVLCEKPFTVSAADARRVVAAARDKGVFCMEAMWMRFMPLVREAKQLVDAGAIGQPLMIKADFGYPASPKAHPSLFSPKLGGGALLDRGVYLLSLSRMILGKPSSWRIQATLGENGVDEQCAMSLSHEGGAIASLSASLRVLAANEAVIMGTRGTLRLHAPFYKPHRLTIKTFDAPVGTPFVPSSPSLKQRIMGSRALRGLFYRIEPMLGRAGRTTTRTYDGNGYCYEAREVTRCVAEGRRESEWMTLDDSLAIVELIEAMQRELLAPQSGNPPPKEMDLA
jgi:predicted dehydrogenase